MAFHILFVIYIVHVFGQMLHVLQRIFACSSGCIAKRGVCAGMKERVLGDPAFLMKLGVEAGMGVITKLLAELHKRPVKFWGELDLVFANIVMSLLADVALIWIPAPRASLTPQGPTRQKDSVQQGSFRRWLAGCPDNAFQVTLNIQSKGSYHKLEIIGKT